MLEILNLVGKYTHICSFRKILFGTKTLLILLMPAFFLAKNYHFLVKIVPLFICMCLFICKTMHPEYGFRIAPNRPKIRKMTTASQFFDMTSSSFFFFLTLFCLSCQVQLLVQVSCQYHHWFWSYANLELTRNPEIGNTPV